MKQPKTTTDTETVKLRKRIGSTVYEVSVHFSGTSKETINDKIVRLIRNDTASGRAVG
ncbi:MAG: transposon-encoded TnpW family protein [Oscillospiraceae bacterium]|nr:transposon-encoded TnpW family protein [Oscillospiraceae bacterium]